MVSDIFFPTLDSLKRFGALLGSLTKPGDTLCLGGALGAGKTTLAQAIAKGAGVDENEYVCSPTFAFMHEYKGIIPIYHMDFYRLGSSDDVLALGLDEYFYVPGITLIEWYERAEDVLPQERLLLKLEITDQNSRKIQLSSPTESWQDRITRLKKTSDSAL
jgi:tRNA threonylcarbamoyladenosine biosynthesis protein TsaE